MGKILVWIFAAGKLGKRLTTGGSMLLSMLVYTWVFGWPYAVGFCCSSFVMNVPAQYYEVAGKNPPQLRRDVPGAGGLPRHDELQHPPHARSRALRPPQSCA
jgi:hypothetical protein